MTNQEFLIEVENSINRSKRVLIKKGSEYATEEGNRLEQFYRAGAAQGVHPTEALIGMAMKHVTSIADMVKDPYKFKLKQFDAKITDLRNYTLLLDALLRDMEIE